MLRFKMVAALLVAELAFSPVSVSAERAESSQPGMKIMPPQPGMKIILRKIGPPVTIGPPDMKCWVFECIGVASKWTEGGADLF